MSRRCWLPVAAVVMTRLRHARPPIRFERGRALRQARAGRRAARRRLRRRVLRPARVAQGGRGGEAAAGRRSISRPPRSRPTSPRLAAPPRGRRRELWALRRQYLSASSRRCARGSRCCRASKLTFDEESRALYDAVAPTKTEAEFEAVLTQLDGEAARRGLADRALRAVQAGVRHSARAARSRVPGSDPRLPRRGRRRTSSCRRRRASPSSTSPASRGAATTGIRATSGA